MELSKYQEVAKRILEIEEGSFSIRMKSYASIYCAATNEISELNKGSCGTCFCLAGWLAHIDEYPVKYRYGSGNLFDHTAYMYDLVSGEGEDILKKTEFLFSVNWPDDLAEAKRRAQYVLDNGTYPPTVGEYPGVKFLWK